MVRALSLWQPWASAVVLGWKRWETRSWSTAYRGPLVIHAARNRTAVPPLEAGSVYPLGCLLGRVQLGRVLPVEVIRDRLSEAEIEWGDYADGRYAWEMLDARVVDPVPWRGDRRLFWIPRSVVPS